MHQKLDALVAQAYGLDVEASDEEILECLVELNKQRAQEEASGIVRWLRPEFQRSNESPGEQDEQSELDDEGDDEQPAASEAADLKEKWPKHVDAQVSVLRAAIKAYPGENRSWHKSRFTKPPVQEFEQLFDAMIEKGVVFETSDGKLY